MKIAQIAPVVERVPPKKYGGTERVVHALTEELVRRGHNVTLFASGDSITSAKLESVAPVSLRELDPYMYGMYGGNQWTLLNIARVYERQNEFDIIHDHTGHIGLPLAQLSRTPVVTTMHGAFLEEENMKIFQSLNKPHVVTISKAQQSIVGPRFIETVYNGLPM
jgi:glycosyltransferase involved in cell wall biosynthesis